MDLNSFFGICINTQFSNLKKDIYLFPIGFKNIQEKESCSSVLKAVFSQSSYFIVQFFPNKIRLKFVVVLGDA
jgi:hypothetical protein